MSPFLSPKNNPSFRGTSIVFISESLKPDPSWEALHYTPSQIHFPFFSSEPSVLIIEGNALFLQQLEKIFSEVANLRLQSQIIIFANHISPDDLIRLFNIKKPFRILTSSSLRDLEFPIQEAFERAHHLKQEKILFELFQEQNKELKRISHNLEERIEKRQQHLQDTKEKLFITNKKNSFLQHCLFTIHNSTNLMDLEQNMTKILQDSYDLKWFRILLGAQQMTNLSKQKDILQLYRFPLLQADTEYGLLVFARQHDHPFRRDEKDFLEQICEAISLCVERTLQIERNKELQSQWQSTFNAILDPVCLIDENYNLKLSNLSLTDKTKSSSIEGQKCYQALFGRTSPCLDCARGESFRLRDQSSHAKIYDVFSQSMNIDYQKNYFHLYRDVSQQLSFERQLVESAKLAELGTISSSIAHELNNPLGGMINFIQLIKMDLNKDNPLMSDVIEMEKAAIRCKEIVKNLLGFSRTASEAETQNILLQDIIHRAIMITELRTRSMGIPIEMENIPHQTTVRGRFNPLAQIFCNVLQNSYESILEKRKKNNGFVGQIQIKNRLSPQWIEVDILDDGMGTNGEVVEHFFDPLFTTKDPEKHSGLGLTLARQILKEHNGQIRLSSQKDGKTCVSIQFPRL